MNKIKKRKTKKDSRKHQQHKLSNYIKKNPTEEIEELMFQRLKEITKKPFKNSKL